MGPKRALEQLTRSFRTANITRYHDEAGATFEVRYRDR
jgi:hypothetical protein